MGVWNLKKSILWLTFCSTRLLSHWVRIIPELKKVRKCGLVTKSANADVIGSNSGRRPPRNAYVDVVTPSHKNILIVWKPINFFINKNLAVFAFTCPTKLQVLLKEIYLIEILRFPHVKYPLFITTLHLCFQTQYAVTTLWASRAQRESARSFVVEILPTDFAAMTAHASTHQTPTHVHLPRVTSQTRKLYRLLGFPRYS